MYRIWPRVTKERRKKKKHTSGDNVVHDEYLLAGLDGTLLDLKVVLAVLLLVGGGGAGAWQLALLADGDEGGVEAQGQRGAEEEAAGVEPDDDVGPEGRGGGGPRGKRQHLELESAQQGGVRGRVEEEGHDVEEDDAGDGEVGEAPQGVEQLYLGTGEFGGGGGGGGGLLSRGILARCCC